MFQSVVVERKIFQVKSEDYNGGKWLSITEKSRGLVVSLDFGEEETGWLVEQLEKAVELEDSMGYIRKMRGKTRAHLMEICFNRRGCYMKITEYSAKRKPLVLVVPRGVNGCGWENLRKVIVSVQEFSVQVGRESKKKQNKLQESKGIYRGERSYAEVVAEKGTRNGAGIPVGKWARAVVCEGKGEIRDWCEIGKAIARRVGMKGMVSVTPISAYKGCFFVENARKAQWLQERGSFTVRGEVFALRRWSPEENSVVKGKFRRGWLELRGLPFHLWDEVQLSHILQQWGRVTKVARNSLKFVDLSKVTLRVEMLPKVVLPALLEVEDGDWSYTVAVTVAGEDDGEDDGGDSIKPESSRSKDEMRSAGGCVLQKPQMVEGLRAIDRTSDCQRWMPRHRPHFSSSVSKSAKGEKGKGRWVSGPMAGSDVGPTPDVFEARSVWAQVGAKDFGPIADSAHNGSPNGGPAASSSSKLQRPGLSAKNNASEGLLQASSKTKGSPVSVRRRARSGPPRFDEASSSPKRRFEGGGSLVTNRGISRGQSHSRKSDFSSGLETPKVSTGETEGEEGFLQCKLFNEIIVDARNKQKMAGELVNSATSEKLTEMDWTKNIEICELVGRDQRQAKDVIKAIKKRLGSKNSNTQLLAVMLLEMLMNNIGEPVHRQVIDNGLLPILVKIVKKKTDLPVREKIFLLLDATQTSLGGASGKFPQYYSAYYDLVSAGVQFPQRPCAISSDPPTSQEKRNSSPGVELVSSKHEEVVQQASQVVPESSIIQKAGAALEVLRDVLDAVDTQHPEGAKDEFTLDLVEQCSFQKQRVMHLVMTSRDEKVVSQAIELNEQLHQILVRHDALLSGTPTSTANHVYHEGEEEEEAEQLFRRLRKGKACALPEDEERPVDRPPFGLLGTIPGEMLNRPLIRPVSLEPSHESRPLPSPLASAIPPPPSKHVEREKYFQENKGDGSAVAGHMRSLSLHSRNASSSHSGSIDSSD